MAQLLEFGEQLGRESNVGRRFEAILQSQQKRQLLASQATSSVERNREHQQRVLPRNQVKTENPKDAHQQLSSLQKRLAKLSSEVTTTLSKHQHSGSSFPSRAAPPPPTPPETPPLCGVKSPKQSDTSLLTPRSINDVLDENAQLRNELFAMKHDYQYLSGQQSEIATRAKEVETEAQNIVRDKEETVRTMKRATEELRAALVIEKTSKSKEEDLAKSLKEQLEQAQEETFRVKHDSETLRQTLLEKEKHESESELLNLKKQLEAAQLETSNAKEAAEQLRHQLQQKVITTPTPNRASESPKKRSGSTGEVPSIPHLQGWSRADSVSTPPLVMSSPSEKKSSLSPIRARQSPGPSSPNLSLDNSIWNIRRDVPSPSPSPPRETVHMSQIRTPVSTKQIKSTIRTPVSDLEEREAEEFRDHSRRRGNVSTATPSHSDISYNDTTPLKEPNPSERAEDFSSWIPSERSKKAPPKQAPAVQQHRPSSPRQQRNNNLPKVPQKVFQSDSSTTYEKISNREKRSQRSQQNKITAPPSESHSSTSAYDERSPLVINKSLSPVRNGSRQVTSLRNKVTRPPSDTNSEISSYDEKKPLVQSSRNNYKNVVQKPKRNPPRAPRKIVANGYESSSDSNSDSQLSSLKPVPKRIRKRRSSLKTTQSQLKERSQSVETQTPAKNRSSRVQQRRSNVINSTFGDGERIPIQNQVPLPKPVVQSYKAPALVSSPTGVIRSVISSSEVNQQRERETAIQLAMENSSKRVNGILSSLSTYKNSTAFDIVHCTPQKHLMPQNSFPMRDDSLSSPIIDNSYQNNNARVEQPPAPIAQNKLQIARDMRIRQRERRGVGEAQSISQLLDCESSDQSEAELWSLKQGPGAPVNSKSPTKMARSVTGNLPEQLPISLIDGSFGGDADFCSPTQTSRHNASSAIDFGVSNISSSSASPPERNYGSPPTPLTEGDMQINITIDDIAKIKSLKDEIAEQAEKLKKQAEDEDERRKLQNERDEKREAEKERIWKEQMIARRNEEEREITKIRASGEEALKAVNETKKQLHELQQQVQAIPNIASVIASSFQGDSDAELQSYESLDDSQTEKHQASISSLTLGKPPVSPKRLPVVEEQEQPDELYSEEDNNEHDDGDDPIQEKELQTTESEQEQQEQLSEKEEQSPTSEPADEVIEELTEREEPISLSLQPVQSVDESDETEPVKEVNDVPSADSLLKSKQTSPSPSKGGKTGKPKSSSSPSVSVRISGGVGNRSATPPSPQGGSKGAPFRSVGNDRGVAGRARSPPQGKGRSPSPGKGRGVSPLHPPGTPSSTGSEIRRATARGSPLTLPRSSTPLSQEGKGIRTGSPYDSSGFGRVVRPPPLGDIRPGSPSDDGSRTASPQGKGRILPGGRGSPTGSPKGSKGGKGTESRSNSLTRGQVAPSLTGLGAKGAPRSNSLGRGITSPSPQRGGKGDTGSGKGSIRSNSAGRGGGTPIASPLTEGKGGVRSNSLGRGITSPSPQGGGKGDTGSGKGSIRSNSAGRGGGTPIATPLREGKGGVRSNSLIRGIGSPVTGKGNIRSNSSGRGTTIPETPSGKGSVRSNSAGRGTGAVGLPSLSDGKGNVRSSSGKGGLAPSPGGKGTPRDSFTPAPVGIRSNSPAAGNGVRGRLLSGAPQTSGKGAVTQGNTPAGGKGLLSSTRSNSLSGTPAATPVTNPTAPPPALGRGLLSRSTPGKGLSSTRSDSLSGTPAATPVTNPTTAPPPALGRGLFSGTRSNSLSGTPQAAPAPNPVAGKGGKGLPRSNSPALRGMSANTQQLSGTPSGGKGQSTSGISTPRGRTGLSQVESMRAKGGKGSPSHAVQAAAQAALRTNSPKGSTPGTPPLRTASPVGKGSNKGGKPSKGNSITRSSSLGRGSSTPVTSPVSQGVGGKGNNNRSPSLGRGDGGNRSLTPTGKGYGGKGASSLGITSPVGISSPVGSSRGRAVESNIISPRVSSPQSGKGNPNSPRVTSPLSQGTDSAPPSILRMPRRPAPKPQIVVDTNTDSARSKVTFESPLPSPKSRGRGGGIPLPTGGKGRPAPTR